jgi:hypothetical protein
MVPFLTRPWSSMSQRNPAPSVRLVVVPLKVHWACACFGDAATAATSAMTRGNRQRCMRVSTGAAHAPRPAGYAIRRAGPGTSAFEPRCSGYSAGVSVIGAAFGAFQGTMVALRMESSLGNEACRYSAPRSWIRRWSGPFPPGAPSP